jgi:hypothetical protein
VSAGPPAVSLRSPPAGSPPSQAPETPAGIRPELLIVDPILSGALLILAGWAADPALLTTQWHSLAG